MQKIHRYFPPGSEWLYYKIYMGSSTSEMYLVEILSYMQDLLEKEIIDNWFFINYNDPDRHIRVRLHLLNPERDLAKVMIQIKGSLATLIKSKIVTRVEIATYNRELERYGRESIKDFEILFHLNSDLVIRIIKHTQNDPEKRWLWCMKSLDSLMGLWGLSLIQKRDLFEYLKNGFGNEMGANKYIYKQLSDKYREKRQLIEFSLGGNEEELVELLDQHNKYAIGYVENIIKKRDLSNFDTLYFTLEGYIHMHCNRLFSSRQRMNEWVIYDFLFQYYRSQVARNKYQEISR